MRKFYKGRLIRHVRRVPVKRGKSPSEEAYRLLIKFADGTSETVSRADYEDPRNLKKVFPAARV